MKKSMIPVMALLMFVSCVRQDSDEDPSDKWNGYSKYLKMGEQVHILWAGKNINVGTAVYGIDDDANFYVTFDCSASGWTISETHMFAGDKKNLPRNKPGSPKIGHFPYSGIHNPRVSSFTYRVPLSSLPPCEEPGFVVASHCVVRSPAGRIETAWAEGDYRFTDKDWGWYDIYYFNQLENEYTILYGLAYANDSLRLYHLDITNNKTELTFTEYVGNSPGIYDGAAYDIDSGKLFFVKVNADELWVNSLDEEDSSFFAGFLSGDVYSATFYNNVFYYVDAVTNTIHGVSFTGDWAISYDNILATIPQMISVNDITMSPEGEYLYILGDVNGGDTELITWEPASGNFFSMSVMIDPGAQVAFGSDGVLYAVAPLLAGGNSSFVYSIDIESGTLTIIEDEIIIIEDPFSDLSGGPVM